MRIDSRGLCFFYFNHPEVESNGRKDVKTTISSEARGTHFSFKTVRVYPNLKEQEEQYGHLLAGNFNPGTAAGSLRF